MNRLPPHGGHRPADEPSPQPAKIQLDTGPWYCWSCGHQMRNIAEGVSLNGTPTLHCCVKCWSEIPIAQRIVIQQKMRADLGETLGALKSLLELAIAEYRGGRTPMDQGGGLS